MNHSAVTIFWFRRDLRIQDNIGLFHALKENTNILPLFIFDPDILTQLKNPFDRRVLFIHHTLKELKTELQKHGSDLQVFHEKPLSVFKKMVQKNKIASVYTNSDYEPKARKRDLDVENFLTSQNIPFKSFNDQCLFEKDEILTGTGKPYTVFTPYKNKVLATLTDKMLMPVQIEKYFKNFHKFKNKSPFPTLEQLGFEKSNISFPSKKFDLSIIKNYSQSRNYPAIDNGTSHLGLHLRFGTISTRMLARIAKKHSEVFLSELIWRDFFKQILWHHPRVASESFRPQYDKIKWRHSKTDLQKWISGNTGYPIVDAGMRELAQTGHMHNRVRMIVASFLTKHLLIHWSEGERYFASQLLDYDLSANNGNWQWAAGCGCDAAPYFRIFNPETQMKKFDPDLIYIRRWVPEFGSHKYPQPMVNHNFARRRCFIEYGKALKAIP